MNLTLDEQLEKIEKDREKIQENSSEVLKKIDLFLELEEEIDQMKNENFLEG